MIGVGLSIPQVAVRNRPPWYLDEALKLNGVFPSMIHDYAGNRYYNEVDGLHAFPFSAVRTTNAMQFDSSGRLVWAPSNMCTQSENFASASWAVTGGGGTKTTGVADPNGGTAACTFTATGANAILQISSGIAVVGQPYMVTMRLRRRTGSGAISIRAIEATNTVVAVTSEWQSFSVVATATTSTFRVGINVAVSGDQVDVAFPQAEPLGVNSPVPYVSTGSSASAYYGPRLNYDPTTLAAMGVQIESAATNIQPISMGATSDWTANFSTITNTGATILGNAAYTFTTTATSGQFAYITANPGALAASTAYVSSIRVKRGNHPRVQLTVTNNCFQPTAADAYVNYNFDTDTLVVAGSALPAPTATRVICSDGSVIISLAYTSGAVPVAGAPVIICCVDTDAATRLGGTATNGATVHVFGGQCEAGAFVTSYIPTFGTAATRGLETPVLTTGAWYNETQGTITCEAEAINSSGWSPFLYSFDDNSINNRAYVIASTTNHSAINSLAGVDQGINSVAIAPQRGTFRKTARRMELNNFNLAVNGTAPATDTVGAVTTGITRMRLGGSSSGAALAVLNGHVKSIAFYKTAGSNAQLQTITA